MQIKVHRPNTRAPIVFFYLYKRRVLFNSIVNCTNYVSSNVGPKPKVIAYRHHEYYYLSFELKSQNSQIRIATNCNVRGIIIAPPFEICLKFIAKHVVWHFFWVYQSKVIFKFTIYKKICLREVSLAKNTTKQSKRKSQ